MGRPNGYTTFCCPACGETYPVSDLSNRALRSAGTRSRLEALEILHPDERICRYCDREQAPVFTPRLRNEAERWEFSGVEIDPAQWQAHILNY